MPVLSVIISIPESSNVTSPLNLLMINPFILALSASSKSIVVP